MLDPPSGQLSHQRSEPRRTGQLRGDQLAAAARPASRGHGHLLVRGFQRERRDVGRRQAQRAALVVGYTLFFVIHSYACFLLSLFVLFRQFASLTSREMSYK